MLDQFWLVMACNKSADYLFNLASHMCYNSLGSQDYDTERDNKYL